METIYCEEIQVGEYKSIHKFLNEFFEGISYATYYSKNDEEQCSRGARRSIEDVLLLVNHYFPNTSMRRAILELNKVEKVIVNEEYKSEQYFICHYCAEVGKFVCLYTGCTPFRDGDTFMSFRDYDFSTNNSDLNYKPKNSTLTRNIIRQILQEDGEKDNKLLQG